jgi:hypothetical protein
MSVCASASGADAVEKVLRRDLKTARDLCDRREPQVALTSLGAGELNRMDLTALGKRLLGQPLAVAKALDVATNQDLRLGHPQDIWALNQ